MAKTPPTSKEKIRMSPRVDRDVVRLAKSKAVALDVTVEWVVEQLLKGWVGGQIALNGRQPPQNKLYKRD